LSPFCALERSSGDSTVVNKPELQAKLAVAQLWQPLLASRSMSAWIERFIGRVCFWSLGIWLRSLIDSNAVSGHQLVGGQPL
jgi:hypothetical protein